MRMRIIFNIFYPPRVYCIAYTCLLREMIVIQGILF